jgi:4-amino-4-deoxy-L-arabinose transferase-like glycosyltransferase
LKNILHKLLSEEPEKFRFLAPFVLFVACFILRLIHLTTQDICIDEPFTIYHAQFGIQDIIRYLEPTNNPPLFELMLHFWIKLFGISEFSVRFLPALFSSLAVIYIYKCGAKYFSFGVGITASLLYIFSTHSVYYAHDCRVYSLFLFLTSASLYFFMKILSGESALKDTIALAVVNVLMVYSHYFGFIVWFIEIVFILIYSREMIKIFFILFVVSIILYLPQFFVLLDRFQHSTSEGTWVKVPNGVEAIYNMLWKFSNQPLATVYCILVMAVSIPLIFIRKEKLSLAKKFFLFAFIIPFTLMYLISFKIPVYNPRYLTFLLPFYYILLSVLAFDIVSNVKYTFVLPLVMIILFGCTADLDPDKKREAKAVTEFINSHRSPGDMVIICTHEFLTNYAYYTDEKLFQMKGEDEYSAIENELLKKNIYPVRSINEIHPSLLQNAKRIIYLDAGADFSNPGNNVLTTLRTQRNEKNKTHFKEIFDVYEFE